MDLCEVAATQHHAFTTPQAKACGHTWRTVVAEVSSGRWLELGRGVFVERAVWDGLDREDQHRCRLHGRLLAMRSSSWSAARRSAAVMHKLPFIGFPPERPQLVRDAGGKKTHGHDRHERIADVPSDDLVEVDSVQATSVLRTFLDIAAEEPFRNAVVVADAALRRGVKQEDLIAGARALGSDVALEAATFAEALAESALESISRVAYRVLQVPLPRPQVKVLYAGEVIARVDNLWDEFNTIGQADGALKYKDSARVMRDKWQDERLESVGFEVVRWGWQDAWQPVLLRGPLKRAFARGRDKTIDPGVRLVQATLAETLATWKRVA
ncbi:MAG: hypothetical protein QOD70_513 [Frankiales bacterium]|nr:hypothetical protein [Frankiales bacterium]